ncbi:hypothetical protein DY000_02049692 [Brassica cretica]|uniref:Uncharacterized protein n=1 Tax=Brassica cretica TaxID=69181 RepID=A0ABQ7F021_BRACR|nr:hypothetical protein DY000_02049692 [Brassica cretica]
MRHHPDSDCGVSVATASSRRENTMVALHARDSQRLRRYGRFTERTKTKLKRRRFLAVLSCGERW